LLDVNKSIASLKHIFKSGSQYFLGQCYCSVSCLGAATCLFIDCLEFMHYFYGFLSQFPHELDYDAACVYQASFKGFGGVNDGNGNVVPGFDF